MNTHTLQNAGRKKQTKQNVVQGIEAGGITGLHICGVRLHICGVRFILEVSDLIE